MQTYNSFNELATAQAAAPLQSQMSVFNGSPFKDNVSEDKYRVVRQAVGESRDRLRSAISAAKLNIASSESWEQETARIFEEAYAALVKLEDMVDPLK